MPPTWMVAAIDGTENTTQSAKTVAHCRNLMENIRPFQRAVLFGHKPPQNQFPIEVVQIPKLDLQGYSLWCIRELWRHVSTDYVLIVQADGYILNPHLWSDDFLCDFIGPPWPRQHSHTFPVGNGGFSIRS